MRLDFGGRSPVRREPRRVRGALVLDDVVPDVVPGASEFLHGESGADLGDGYDVVEALGLVLALLRLLAHRHQEMSDVVHQLAGRVVSAAGGFAEEAAHHEKVHRVTPVVGLQLEPAAVLALSAEVWSVEVFEHHALLVRIDVPIVLLRDLVFGKHLLVWRQHHPVRHLTQHPLEMLTSFVEWLVEDVVHLAFVLDVQEVEGVVGNLQALHLTIRYRLVEVEAATALLILIPHHHLAIDNQLIDLGTLDEGGYDVRFGVGDLGVVLLVARHKHEHLGFLAGVVMFVFGDVDLHPPAVQLGLRRPPGLLTLGARSEEFGDVLHVEDIATHHLATMTYANPTHWRARVIDVAWSPLAYEI
mmetsp:Transcript_26905/g.67003  ORF Transcript_26905/g.67003 Transcript_26905/m.67003 type:complete len:358 (-) Transcript_26905:480-1553(-)